MFIVSKAKKQKTFPCFNSLICFFKIVKPNVSIFFNSSQQIPIKSNYKTTENSSEIILCSVKSNPKPTKIEWYKDHKLLGINFYFTTRAIVSYTLKTFRQKRNLIDKSLEFSL
jgi:hypothetical protein